ncbi:T9SS type A sorting domain-containing protein [Constantimarinum furrinae]|uniref:Secretion system C-terminal sorting domain-containing protein n=1 Tax=Constantimarinum furrinae TaxID=2562285 RepID=A0A7G8PX67_9FLAO|nr:T9SS type A sorting domain-containing protein [Constantimarinum furrinae]QNJ98933.1 hypothetical protein ALE3EI_2395 [Constantimarinum furrinae]
MRTLYLFLLLICIPLCSVNAQLTDVVTGLNDPSRLLLNGNDLYFTTPSTISKIDITVPSPTPEVVVTGLSTATGMVLNGNDLYVAQFNGGKISKIDISNPNPTVQDVITGLNTPNGLAIRGNFIYFSDNNNNTVRRVDYTNPGAPEVVATSAFNFNPIGLVFDDNLLYISSGIANRVSTVDVTSGVTTPVDVVVGVNRPLGIRLNSTNLYIAERNDNKISVNDITSGSNIAEDLVTGLNQPSDIALNNEFLFILESGANKISKYPLLLGIEESNASRLTLYPNPANGGIINISGVQEPAAVAIMNMLGQKVKELTLSPMEEIDISDLASGSYILSIDDTTHLRFIKN